MTLKFMICTKLLKLYKVKKKSLPTKKIEELEVRIECINKKLFSPEKWERYFKEKIIDKFKEVLGFSRN